MLGFFTRPACALIVMTMVVAAARHLGLGQGISGASHAIENGVVLLGMMLIGPGTYSLDEQLAGRRGSRTGR